MFSEIRANTLLAVQEGSVLDIGVVEKSGNFVGSVLHLPSNVLVKSSSATAEKAVALCLRDLNNQISKLNWFWIHISDGDIIKLSINGHFNFACTGTTVISFEKYLDDSSILLSSLHQFNFNGKRHSGYVCNPNSYQKLLEVILNHSEFELLYC
jgi:hypothetical protein